MIDAGAIIWSLSDGKVDSQNFRMFIAMSGYRAAGAIDQLTKYRDTALNAKAEKGLLISGRAFWSHKIVRGEYVRAVGYVADESKRRAFDDLAQVSVAGVGWEDINAEMARRGHPTTGKSFEWYRRVFHPTWWGYAARHFSNTDGAWTNDVVALLSATVTVWRNVYPAVWTGEQPKRKSPNSEDVTVAVR